MELPTVDIVAIAIGNTRGRVGHFADGRLVAPASFEHARLDEVVLHVKRTIESGSASCVVVCSVHAGHADAIERALSGFASVFRLGRDLPFPIAHTLIDDATVGHDRLACAIGAYRRARQACVIVDAGTAITVDFVDGQGTFMGGAIMPGVRMMFASLHERTSALPMIEFDAGGVGALDLAAPQGRDTREAMRLGVLECARGGVHRLIERYALAYGAYPQIVATGGDAEPLFAHDPTIEYIVPDLQLMGIFEACSRLVELNDGEG